MVRKRDRQKDRWLKEREKKIEFMSQFQTDRLGLQKRQLYIRYELVDIWLERKSYRQIIILLDRIYVCQNQTYKVGMGKRQKDRWLESEKFRQIILDRIYLAESDLVLLLEKCIHS